MPRSALRRPRRARIDGIAGVDDSLKEFHPSRMQGDRVIEIMNHFSVPFWKTQLAGESGFEHLFDRQTVSAHLDADEVTMRSAGMPEGGQTPPRIKVSSFVGLWVGGRT